MSSSTLERIAAEVQPEVSEILGEAAMHSPEIRARWERAGQTATDNAQETLRTRGISFFDKKDGVIVEELPDGSIRPAVTPECGVSFQPKTYSPH